MKLTRKSQLSGETNTMDLDITPEQVRKYNSGAFVQDAFPNLTADEREFILTGITPTEWDSMFGAES